MIAQFPSHYALLLGGTCFAVVIGITCSQAYNSVEGEAKGSFLWQAKRKRNAWLHANFSWQAINMWMTITPLYCTCATIYLSGKKEQGELDNILIYSILSLVMSLGIYVVRPANRATGYRRAYNILNAALTRLEITPTDIQSVAQAMVDGEKIVEEQDTLDPK